MKQLYKNKHWEINKDYNIDKILYLLIDRPNHINSYDEFVWFNIKGQYHREYDLPSFISINGSHVYWYNNSELHRNNYKPAVIWFNGIKEYKIIKI